MLKNLAIATVFGAFLFWGPDVPKKNQGAPHAASDVTAPNTQPANSPVYGPDCCKTESPNGQNAPQEKPLPWFLRPEWVIVYVTIGYAIIAWRTLRAIKRQGDTLERQVNESKESAREATEVARKAADAALLNAQAVIASERPFLTVKPRTKTGNYFEIVAKNCGKSPAEILIFGSEFRILDNRFGPPLPVLYQSDELTLTVKIVVPPGGKEIVNTMPLMIDSIDEGAPADMEKVRKFQKFLFFWGTVKYQSALSKERKGVAPYETRWCFRYIPGDGSFISPRLERDGQMQYNENT